MNTAVRNVPPELVQETADKLIHDVTTALNAIVTQDEQFIVNPTPWYQITDRGLTPTVVNSAKFITSTFQNALVRYGWEKEVRLQGQKVDGYIELMVDGGVSIGRGRSVQILTDHYGENPQAELDLFYLQLYQCYVKRTCFSPGGIPDRWRSECSPVAGRAPVRIALEFETGNIASSFRAFSKLGSLFREDQIDAAVFITSVDKPTAAGLIWPLSNRNSTFEELDRRGYRKTIFFPMLEISFAPDGISTEAPYLGDDGNTYFPEKKGKTVDEGGIRYEAYWDQKQRREILLQEQSAPTLF